MIKKLLLLSTLTAVSHLSQANTLVKLNQCAAINDSLERLVCYDELAKGINQGKVAQTMPAIPKNSTPAATQQVDITDSFGKEHIKSKAQENLPDAITLTIQDLSKTVHGEWLITFTNGQEWKQTDGEYFKLKKGENVELKKGMLGAIYLKKFTANKRIRVKRLK